MTDPRIDLKHAIVGALTRPIGDPDTWADDMIRWLHEHGWRPPDHVRDWRETRRDPPPADWHQARAAIRAKEAT